jgi:hypothetical protein
MAYGTVSFGLFSFSRAAGAEGLAKLAAFLGGRRADKKSP